MRRFGPDVNLSQHRSDDVLALETLRLGLRSDTLGIGGRRERASRACCSPATARPTTTSSRPAFQGFTDTPLNDTGRAQAPSWPSGSRPSGTIRALWASDLSRARETARDRRRADRPDAPSRPAAAGGQPRRVGGAAVHRHRARGPRAVRGWLRAGASFRFPGGESLQDQLDRVTAALEDIHARRRAPRARRLPRRVDPRDALQPRSAGPRRVSRVRGPERGSLEVVTRLPTCAFAVLVAATIAAFFVTQHLKVTTPLIRGSPAPVPAVIDPLRRHAVRR